MFAAYDDLSIYAVSKTAIGAIRKARKEAGPDSRFKAARVSSELATWIESRGWHGNFDSFEVRDGEIFDTTERPEQIMREAVRKHAESRGALFRVISNGEVHYHGQMPNSQTVGWYFVAHTLAGHYADILEGRV